MGLFRSRINAATVKRRTGSEIRQYGTPIRAVVSDVIIKRNGYIVMALHEDRELGTQHSYASRLLTERPCVYVGGEVIVYVDVSINGDYFVDC